MKTTRNAVVLIVMMAAMSAMTFDLPGQGVPGAINYQGRLLNSGGQPVTTPVDLTFSLWDHATTGTQLGGAWSDTDTVTPDINGVYSTTIGDEPGNPVPTSIFNSADVWLNVNVEGEDLTPRARLLTVPYAASANILSGEAFLMVPTTSDPATNGANLLATYAAAKSLTPHGHALSAMNRATVIVPPGFYQLDTMPLTLDAEYVDVVGLTTSRNNQFLYGEGVFDGSTTGVIRQTANDVRIENLLVKCTLNSGSLSWNATDPAAYFPNTDLANTVIRNCEFKANDANALSMRLVVEYSGTYEDCTGGDGAFGGWGTASGKFSNCTGGELAFGGGGIASGTFTNCTSGIGAFAGYGTASGTFTDCTGGRYAFGASDTASGTFINCIANNNSFGYAGTASGIFTNCTSGSSSFGGNGGTASGTFTDCTATDYSFGYNGTASGTFTNCTGGDNSFGGGSGTATGGEFYHCVGGAGAFTTAGFPVPVHIACTQNGAPYSGNNDDSDATNELNTTLALNGTTLELTDDGGMLSTSLAALQDGVTDADADPKNELEKLGEAFVIVQTTASPTTNGTNLIAAYNTAKALTPHGSILSATNRATVILPPGKYDLGTGALTLDTQYVDIVGLSTARDDQYIYGLSNGANSGVLMQSASNVRIENLVIECTRASGGLSANATDPAAYFPTTNLPGTVMRNCEFKANDSYARSMRMGIDYSGAFEDCTGGDFAFGGEGTASGTFTNCTGGNISFAGYGTASGTFTNCTSGHYSFGADDMASGAFINCIADDNSFGYAGTASGIFTNCTSGSNSFGGSGGMASGTFTNCIGGLYAFGGSFGGTASGIFSDCTATTGSFGGQGGTTTGGEFYNCRMTGDWDNGQSTTFNGKMHYCQWADSITVGASAQIGHSVFNGYSMDGATHVSVNVTNNATTNGLNLIAAYAAAKALTPHGSALSATNRTTVLVPPGNYDLGTAPLTLDTEFVDIVGLSTVRDDQYIYGLSGGTGTGVLQQSASDVRIENLVVECTRASGGVSWNATDPAAYFPNTNLANTVIRNCEFKADDTNAWSMRMWIAYPGAFENCTGGVFAFGGFAPASGTFTDCIGGDYAFGSYDTASGTFTNCTGGASSFGGDGGTASGTFTDCIGGIFSFGSGSGGGTANGVFINCTGGNLSFGSSGSASGTFTNCTGGNDSFGGNTGTANGTFTDCTGGDYSFGGTASGTFTNCTGGDRSFGGSWGAASGTFSDCTAATGSFGGRGGTTTGGEFFNCRMTGDWDDGQATTFTGKMQDCHWADGITCGAAARIYSSVFLGDVDLNGTAAGIAGSYVNDSINNTGSASFNANNLESVDIN